MAPSGEMFRYPQHFGENVLRHGSHEWLPYSVDEVRLKSSNTNLSNCCIMSISVFPEGIPQLSIVHCQLNSRLPQEVVGDPFPGDLGQLLIVQLPELPDGDHPQNFQAYPGGPGKPPGGCLGPPQ